MSEEDSEEEEGDSEAEEAEEEEEEGGEEAEAITGFREGMAIRVLLDFREK